MWRMVLIVVVVAVLVGGCKVTSKREPGIAVLCSLLIPGGGQFYNGQIGKGFGFLVSETVALSLFLAEVGESLAEDGTDGTGGGAWLALWLGLRVWELIDAGVSAGKVNVSLGLTYVDEPRPALCYRLAF